MEQVTVKPSDRFKRMLDQYEDDPEYVAEGILIDINEQIVRLMKHLDMNKSQLAEKLGVSNAYVTKLLGGNENLTIKQLVRIVAVLNSRIDVAVAPKNATIQRMFRYVSKKVQLQEYGNPVALEESYESNCSIAA
jgi:transcriptional regulator with XRE-family HTH domain